LSPHHAFEGSTLCRKGTLYYFESRKVNGDYLLWRANLDKVDQRNKLKEDVFSYRLAKDNKDNKVYIFLYSKQVTVLSGEKGKKFLSRIENSEPHEAQLIMAKATSNFKRGNEKNQHPN
jgi:hypothetical protein